MTDLSIIISAPSGAGKSTIINRLLACDGRLQFSTSTTTRAIRNGEEEGVNYYYSSVENFKKKIEGGHFIEWACVHDNYYGTEKKEIDRIRGAGKIPVFDVDVQGASILRNLIERGTYIFITPPSISELKKRLRNRKTDSEEQIELRLRNALEELSQYTFYDYIVVNSDLEVAVRQIQSIITAEECSQMRMTHNIESILEDTQ